MEFVYIVQASQINENGVLYGVSSVHKTHTGADYELRKFLDDTVVKGCTIERYEDCVTVKAGNVIAKYEIIKLEITE